MSNIPGWTSIPSADSPYPVKIGDSVGYIDTDNCGVEFVIVGDKYHAATALLDRAWSEGKRFINHNFTHREGAFSFVFENRKIVKVKPYYDFTAPYIDFSPEKRPEVLEMIEIVNKMISLTAFL